MKTMKEKESHPSRRGFTLLEMIVVIGILGILIAVMMPFLGHLRDGSKMTQCKNNMQNLAKAAITYANQRSENDGHFPAAGFYRSLAQKAGHKVMYYPQRPWISNYGSPERLNNTISQPELGSVVHFTDTDDVGRFAVTNGAIWEAVDTSFEVYRCPVHASNYEKKKGRLPWWSYVMNQEFGFKRQENRTQGHFGPKSGKPITVSKKANGLRGKGNETSRSPDKVLMFAEVQGADVNADGVSLKTTTDGDKETDAILEYAQNEVIGFTHPMGKGRYGGNVAFADGHVETIVMPSSAEYHKRLTRYLCQGYDVPHDGSSTYTPQEGVDD